MTAPPIIAAVGVVDAERVHGSRGVQVTWHELGMTPPGTGRALRAIFARQDDTFRRLDPTSRALVLAAEAAGIAHVLPPTAREDTALVIATTLGCLDADLQFARSLASEMCDAPVFPYTLPSTCLGEIALRLGLRGTSLCLSVLPGGSGSALAEAQRLLAGGEARYVVVANVEVLVQPHADVAPTCRVVVAVVAAADAELSSVAPWPGVEGDAFARLAGSIQQPS